MTATHIDPATNHDAAINHDAEGFGV